MITKGKRLRILEYIFSIMLSYRFFSITFLVLSILRNVLTTRSPAGLIILAELELEIYKSLTNYIEDNPKKHKTTLKIQEFLIDFEESALNVVKTLKEGETFGATITNNPLSSYRMIRRYALMLQSIHQELPGVLKRKMPFWKWPSTLDLNDAMDALLRIQHVYNMDVNHLLSGNILGVETNIELTGRQCYELGQFALLLKQYTNAILWIEAAFNKMKTTEPNNGLTKDILKSLQMATEEHDIAWDTKTEKGYYFFNHKLNDTNVNGDIRTSFRQRISRLSKEQIRHIVDDEVRFWEVCSDKNHQTNQELSQLFCWYETRRNGIWTISPVKIEQLSVSPYLIQFYDVLYDKFIKELKIRAIPGLQRPVRSRSGDPNVIDQDFVLGFFSAKDGHVDAVFKLSQITELITGLKLANKHSEELFQVTAYPWGGMQGNHLDFLKVNTWMPEYKLGNMIGTLIFYLEDAIGGQTGFPRIGVAARSVKGSALLYFNQFRNGKRDNRMLHGGCPVVMGQKWIFVKSMHYNPQMLIRPCTLNPNE